VALTINWLDTPTRDACLRSDVSCPIVVSNYQREAYEVDIAIVIVLVEVLLTVDIDLEGLEILLD
jgi:hypothetical protein